MRRTRRLNRFSLFLVLCFVIISWQPTIKGLQQNSLLGTAIVILVMAAIGIAAPNIPFNRFIGLRLLWTIRDEDTWNIAHRLLGSITFPLIVLVLIGGLTGKPETFIKIGIFSWIAVTGGYSAWFYYRKFS